MSSHGVDDSGDRPDDEASEGLLSRARRASGDAAKSVVEAIKGPADGSRSASGAGASGYVHNRESDEAVADLDESEDQRTRLNGRGQTSNRASGDDDERPVTPRE